jgi:hypothetical protein
VSSYVGSEIWALRKRGVEIVVNGDEIFQKNSRYTLFDHERNEDILKELKVEPVDKKLRRHNSNWLRNEQQLDGKDNAEL